MRKSTAEERSSFLNSRERSDGGTFELAVEGTLFQNLKVHDFHHKTYYLALEGFERESFWENVLLVSVVCLSHSLSVVLLTSLFIFWGLVFRSLRFILGWLLGGKDFVDVTLV